MFVFILTHYVSARAKGQGEERSTFGCTRERRKQLPVLMEGRRFKLKKQRRSNVLERGAHVEISFGF